MQLGSCPHPDQPSDDSPSTAFTRVAGDADEALAPGLKTLCRGIIAAAEDDALEDDAMRRKMHSLVDRYCNQADGYDEDDEDEPAAPDGAPPPQNIDGAVHPNAGGLTRESLAALSDRIGVPGPSPLARHRLTTKAQKKAMEQFEEAVLYRADEVPPSIERREGEVYESGRRAKPLKPITPGEANAFATRVLART